jgi:transcriptional regulator with XRE-family HTH domain
MTGLPIREWCDALGISQAALARKAGMAPAVLSDYARGRRNPTLRSIEAIARALGRLPWELLRGPLPGEGLPTEEEARVANLSWFQRLTPSQKARAVETSRRFTSRAQAFARARRRRRGRGAPRA